MVNETTSLPTSRRAPKNSIPARLLAVLGLAVLLLAAVAGPARADTDPCASPQWCGAMTSETSERIIIKNSCAKDAILYFNAGLPITAASNNCNNAACHWGYQQCPADNPGCDCTQAGSNCTWTPFFGEPVSLNGVSYKVPIPAGQTVKLPVPLSGAASGSWSFAYGCTDTSGDFGTDCTITAQQAVHTKSEFTAGCVYADTSKCTTNPGSTQNPKGPLVPGDNYDISAVDGYDLPISLSTVNASTCSFGGAKDGGMLDLASCAKEYGYNANAPQTFSILPVEVPHYQSTYNTLSANPNGISMATTVTVNSTSYYSSCTGPCAWYSNTIFGTPPNPGAMASGRWNPATSKIDTTVPGTSDYYCCANTCGKTACIDGVAGCQCVCPGCRGTQCSKGLLGTAKQFAIQYTNYVKQLKAIGWQGYTWAYDDSVGDIGCGWTAGTATASLPQVTYELCPNGGDPIRTDAAWTYCPSLGKCVAAGACSGATQGTYSSLFQCQSTDPTASNKYKIRTDKALGNLPTIPDSYFSYCVWDGVQGTLAYADCIRQTTPTGGSVVPTDYLLLMQKAAADSSASWVIGQP